MKSSESGQVNNWSNQWSHFSDYLPQYSEQLKRWLSLDDPEAFFYEKHVLDAGCGNGRNTLTALKWGAKETVSFDVLEKTVNVARTNLSEFKNASVLRASIYDVPEELGHFDVVMCIGVLHHLESPREALGELISRLAPNGRLIVWVYGNQSKAVPLIRLTRKVLRTSRLPFRVLLGLSRVMAFLLKAILVMGRSKAEYWAMLRRFSVDHLTEIIVDQLHPRIAHYFSEYELRMLFSDTTKYPFIIQEVNGMSWSVTLTRAEP